MVLSNTAVPKYYGEFRQKVLHGEIPVNREIAMEMNRIDRLIANPNYYYDDEAIDGFIRYCEAELTLTNGDDFIMLDSFKLWAEALLSWYHFVERKVWVANKQYNGAQGGRMISKRIKQRLINKQYLIVARGGAKSMYAMCIQAYFLNIDRTTTRQVTTAPTMKQAEEVMQPFRTAITRARGPLFAFLTDGTVANTRGNRFDRAKLVSTKRGIENLLTGSLLEIRPMSIDKLQGMRSKINTVDEWLSGDVREDVVGAIEQGAKKEKDWVIVAISSEGIIRNGVGDTIKLELAKILRGEYQAPNVSIWHYKLDDVSEVGDPNMWIKAQPNIGITVLHDDYQQEVDRAENAPAARNDILAKRFGLAMEGFTYFFTYEETLPHPHREFRGFPASLGIDLSAGDDFCAFTFLFPLKGERYGVKTRSYITTNTLRKLPGAMREKYEEFRREGSLHVLDGTVLDLDEVYEDLEKHIEEMEYDIRSVGYDPWGAKEFMGNWVKYNTEFGVEKVIQGARTESVPLGELKALASERLLIFDELLMQFGIGNAVTLEDTNGNRKLVKVRADQKIDNVSALMDAYVAYKLNKELFE